MSPGSYSSSKAKHLCVERTLPPITLDELIGSKGDEHTRQLLGTLISMSRLAEEEQRLLILTSGFVADFAEGALQRDHHDLDLLILRSDFAWFRNSLTDRDFTITPFKRKNPAVAFQATRGDEVIDVGAVSVTASAVSDATDLDGSLFTWPIRPTQFLWNRTIDNTPIFFVNPSVISIFKEQATRQSAQDVQDLAILARHITH